MEQQIKAKLNLSEERVFLDHLIEFKFPYPQNIEGLKAIVDNRFNALKYYECERRSNNSFVELNSKGVIETTIFNFEGFSRRTLFEEILIKVFDHLYFVLIEEQNRIDTEKLKMPSNILVTANDKPPLLVEKVLQLGEKYKLKKQETVPIKIIREIIPILKNEGYLKNVEKPEQTVRKCFTDSGYKKKQDSNKN